MIKFCMKALIQRISEAEVKVGEDTIASVSRGLLIFLGIEKADTTSDIDYLVRKISGLRIFEDSTGKMNLSIKDISGEALVVSQFTLLANTSQGNRPSFERAEEPVKAKELYEKFIHRLREAGVPTKTGEFGSLMKVRLINEGPVTIMLNSKRT